MTPDLKREEALFNAASEIPILERAAFLAVECAENEALRRRVEALLNCVEKADEFFQTAPLPESRDAPPFGPISQSSDPIITGHGQIGPYQLCETLGEGGFGTVYVAEQTAPVRRRVALKVIKAGMDTRDVIARFNSERQALALMDHPNIARVLDAGSTEAGRPFFVMELVQGLRITDYCDREQLSIRDRLALIIDVCRAVQHAHQKGIIHRDLKPSNILVVVQDGRAVPKVIDFGIAKATEGRLTDASVVTCFNRLIGTPAYMSPEQAESGGLNVDTRSDIYSLGVVLYELLVGTTPFDAQKLVSSGFETMCWTIRNQDPPRPSTRLRALTQEQTSLMTRYRSVPQWLHQVRGDLDWIVMKCLEKDRARRYETANGLALDLQRSLDHEPILARPPSTVYRVQKAWRRNRLAFGVVAAIALLLITSVVVSTWLMLNARTAERAAELALHSEEQQRLKSELAQKTAETERQRADAAAHQAAEREQHARRLLYAADMKLSQQALKNGNLGTARGLLDRHRPQSDEEDLRGWEWRYLWRQTRSDALYLLCKKPVEIHALSAARSAPWLALQADNNEAPTIFSVAQRDGSHSLPWAPFPESRKYDPGFAFSPDGTLFAAADHEPGQDGFIRFYETATGQVVARLPIRGRCLRLFFSETGHRLVSLVHLDDSSPKPQEVTLWDSATLEKISQFRIAVLSRTESSMFATSDDGGLVAYVPPGVDSKSLFLLNLTTGEERKTGADSDEIQSLAFTPDGRMIATGQGGSGRSIRLWDVPTLNLVDSLEGHRLWINALVFWPDGKTLASAGADGSIRLWNIETREPLGRPLLGHEGQVWQLALIPQHSILVSGGSEGSVLVWDATLKSEDRARPSDGVPVHDRIKPDRHPSQADDHFYGRASAWIFTPDSQGMFTCNFAGDVRYWTGLNFDQPTDWLNVGTGSFRVLFSEDCRWLATSTEEGSIAIWDMEKRERRYQLPHMPGRALSEHFTHEGSRLFVRYRDQDSMQEWDLPSEQVVQTWGWEGPENAPRNRPFAFSHDDRWCLTLGWNGTARLRDLTTQQELVFASNVTRPAHAVFSPDGKYFAAANLRDFVSLWTLEPLREAAVFNGFLMGVTALAFSPDSQRLVITSRWGDAVKIYDVASGQELLALEENGAIHFPLAFSPDGNILAGADSMLARVIWRVPSWQEISASEAAQSAPSPPGGSAASGSLFRQWSAQPVHP
jgi:eukaryotic-like serine/threonine-protein kinase